MRAAARPVERHPHARATVFVAACALALTMVQLGTADAQQPPYDRGVTDACVDQAMQADQFADVDLGRTHAASINCLWVYGVVQGRFVDG